MTLNEKIDRQTTQIWDINVTPADIAENTFESGVYSFWLTVRNTLPTTTETNDTNAIISKQVNVNVLNTDTSIITSIELTPNDTNIDPKKYWYDIQMKTPSSRIYNIISTSVFEVMYDITRDTV